MRILARYKKKEMEGFKNFVQYLESLSEKKRSELFLLTTLEDPLYLFWVSKNLLSVSQFLLFDRSEIHRVCQKISGPVLLQAFCQTPEEVKLLSQISRDVHKHYLDLKQNAVEKQKTFNPIQREQARGVILKTIRELQEKELIGGQQWKLPTLEIVKMSPCPTHATGPFEQHYDHGAYALKGQLKDGKREGTWEHFYTSGKLLSRGEYNDGLKVGKWIFYYSDDKKRSECKFHQDFKVQESWKEWDRKGREIISHYSSLNK